MSRAVLHVHAAGPHATIQDGGRRGLMRFGVPASGPMDRLGFAAANAALGNPPEAAGIEVSLGGIELECVEGEVSLAVAGGGFGIALDGREAPGWCVRRLRAGERLAVRRGFWGSWCAVALAGRLEAKRFLGSVATHGPSGLGGGRVVAGDRLVVEEPRLVPDREIPLPAGARLRGRARVVLGPQERFFPAGTVEAFLSQPFSLSDAYDRMGVRLRGAELKPEASLSIPSEPVLRGAVQVSGDGAATVLLADHQTTGGYPKIATLIGPDLDGFAQLRPRSPVAFQAVTPEAAVAIARTEAMARARYLERLAP